LACGRSPPGGGCGRASGAGRLCLAQLLHLALVRVWQVLRKKTADACPYFWSEKFDANKLAALIQINESLWPPLTRILHGSENRSLRKANV